MDKQQLQARMKRFILNVIYMTEKLSKNTANIEFTRQLIRCSSSVGANYRAACRAKSDRDFINKLKIVEEEADESGFFLDLLNTINPDLSGIITKLLTESEELLKITVSSIKTARGNSNKS